MITQASYSSITSRLKERKRRGDGSSVHVDVSQFVPERTLPEWVKRRSKRHGAEKLSAQVFQDGGKPAETKTFDSSPINVAMARLDLNNMRKDWKSGAAKQAEAIRQARISQNRRPESVRGFPGGLRSACVPSNSPMALFSSSTNAGRNFKINTTARGEDSISAMLLEDSAKEDPQGNLAPLLTDNTHLSLDESKLPLEVCIGQMNHA